MFSWVKKLQSKTVLSPEKSAMMFAFFTLLTTVIGIFRERIMATVVGPGPVLDAYSLAHKIPDFLYATTATMVAATILLPYLAQKKDTESQISFLSQIYTVFSLVTVIVCLLLIVFAPFIVPVLGLGFDQSTLDMAIQMTQVLLISPLLMGTGNILGSALQLHKRFLGSSLAPLFYNIGTLLGVSIGYPVIGFIALPVGIVIGALCHMYTQLLFVEKSFVPKFTLNIDWKMVRSMISASLPRTFSASISAIITLGIISFASLLPAGSVSLVAFALVIQNVPITLVGLSLSMASFPVLVELATKRDNVGFSARMVASARMIVLIAIPITAIFSVLSLSIVTLLFHSGKFSAVHSHTTALLVSIIALSVTSQSLIQLGVRIYYAQNETWQPFWKNFFGMVTTFSLAGISLYFDYNSLVVLVICIVIGALSSSLFMWIDIVKKYATKTDTMELIKTTLVSTLAGLAMYIVGFLIQHHFVMVSVGDSLIKTILYSCVTGISMLVTLIVVYLAFGLPELVGIKNRILLWKKK